MSDKWKKKTKVVGLGRDLDRNPGMVNTPVYRASTILFKTVADLEHAVAHRNDELYYGRRGTPTQWSLREALRELEGGAGCALYSSGLAAVTTAILAFVRSGDHILMVDTAYEPTRIFCELGLKRLGVEVTYYDPLIGGEIEKLFKPNTKVVFAESPGSLTFEVQDLPAIAKAAHHIGAKVLMDNTYATPLFYNALEHGADVSIHAATKYIVGHSDAMLGAAIANEDSWEALQRHTFLLGHASAPDDVYLATRGLRTLSVRLAQHQESALKIAHWLRERPEVDRVLHPAFEECPGHDIWKRDFSGSSGLFSIVLKKGDDRAVAAMLDGLELFGIGFSWGGYESLVLPVDPTPDRTATTWRASGPLLRFHIGLEDADDLIEDLEKGFDRLNTLA